MEIVTKITYCNVPMLVIENPLDDDADIAIKIGGVDVTELLSCAYIGFGEDHQDVLARILDLSADQYEQDLKDGVYL